MNLLVNIQCSSSEVLNPWAPHGSEHLAEGEQWQHELPPPSCQISQPVGRRMRWMAWPCVLD